MTETVIPDRPWDTREYGRLRLNEVFAGELLQVLADSLDDLHAIRQELQLAGKSVTTINRRIRRISTIRELLHGMMHEKNWCNCG
jgi:hypothetical protein